MKGAIGVFVSLRRHVATALDLSNTDCQPSCSEFLAIDEDHTWVDSHLTNLGFLVDPGVVVAAGLSGPGLGPCLGTSPGVLDVRQWGEGDRAVPAAVAVVVSAPSAALAVPANSGSTLSLLLLLLVWLLSLLLLGVFTLFHDIRGLEKSFASFCSSEVFFSAQFALRSAFVSLEVFFRYVRVTASAASCVVHTNVRAVADVPASVAYVVFLLKEEA